MAMFGEEIKIFGMDNIKVYFTFINQGEYTVYAIQPKVTDDTGFRTSILKSNPDYKLLPGERRDLLVLDDRSIESLDDKLIEFMVYAVDSEGNLRSFPLEGIKSIADTVIISN